jgi:uncharacterized integral membrane protein
VHRANDPLGDRAGQGTTRDERARNREQGEDQERREQHETDPLDSALAVVAARRLRAAHEATLGGARSRVCGTRLVPASIVERNLGASRPERCRHPVLESPPVADQQQPSQVGRQGTNWKGWAMLVAVVLLLIFVIQNSQEVNIDFLFFTSVSTPLILALVFSALLGALIGWLAPRVRRRD